jgi:vitamin K-dependent gamma-carboxylase
MNSQMFDIGIFPPFMILATLVFFRPDWPRRLLFKSASDPAFAPATPVALTPRRRMALGCAGLWLAVQLLLPLRQYLYPGEASWTEYGHRFAWRMMLRAKDCPAVFHVTDPSTGRTGTMDLRPYLTQWQVEKLGREPDMLIEFSHFLAADLRQKGYGTVEVRAQVLTSLNGRKPQLFIDPRIDLARERRKGWGTYPWVLPLVEPLRDSPWDVPLLEWEHHVELNPDLVRQKDRARE